MPSSMVRTDFGKIAPAAFAWPPPWNFNAICSASPLRLRKLAKIEFDRRNNVISTGYFVAPLSKS